MGSGVGSEVCAIPTTVQASIAALIMKTRTVRILSASAAGKNSRHPNTLGQGGKLLLDLDLIGRHRGLLRPNFLDKGS
jgi:hypothetical protein